MKISPRTNIMGSWLKLTMILILSTATVQYGYRNQAEYKEFMWVSIYATAPDWSPVAPATQLALNKFGPMMFMINHNEGKTSTIEARLTSKSSIAAGDKF